MAQGRKTALRITLDPDTQRELETWQRSTRVPTGLARRGRIILLLARGESVMDISRAVGIHRRHVYKWADRFLTGGARALADMPGRGRKSRSSAATAAAADLAA